MNTPPAFRASNFPPDSARVRCALRPAPNPPAIRFCPPDEHEGRTAKRMIPPSLAPSDGEREGVRGLSAHCHPLLASLNDHRPLLKNDQASSPANPASTPSPSHAFRRRATPAFNPETTLKRVETTLKWLETRLKRLEINVETLKRFKHLKTSTSIYQRLTKTEPLKREKNLQRSMKTTPVYPLDRPVSAPRGACRIASTRHPHYGISFRHPFRQGASRSCPRWEFRLQAARESRLQPRQCGIPNHASASLGSSAKVRPFPPTRRFGRCLSEVVG